MRRLVLFLAVIQAGCSVPKAGSPLVVSHNGSTGELLIPAPQDGVYELRTEGDASEPIARVRLLADESFGFEQVSNPGVPARYAIAGSNPDLCPEHKRIQLDQGNYYWALAPESEIKGPRWKWAMQKLAKKYQPGAPATLKECVAGTVAAVTITSLFLGAMGLYVYGLTRPNSQLMGL